MHRVLIVEDDPGMNDYIRDILAQKGFEVSSAFNGFAGMDAIRSSPPHVVILDIFMPDMRGVEGPPGWRVHQLTGDRAATWSISASGNWRITFDLEQGEICNLDLEDYH